MEQTCQIPDFYTVQMLSEKLKVTPTRIVIDLLSGVINSFAFLNMNRKTHLTTRKRIKTIMPIVNLHTRKHLNETPQHIIFPKVFNFDCINEDRQYFLTNNISSDDIFELWLKEYGININNIKLVIPSDEAIKYETYLQTMAVNTPSDNSNSVDINNIIAQKRNEIDCNKSKCTCCVNKKCRSQLAYELVTNYGFRTPYRTSLCEIGIAMGCNEPKWAKDKSNPEHIKNQKLAKDAIKSQVKRWLASHSKLPRPQGGASKNIKGTANPSD